MFDTKFKWFMAFLMGYLMMSMPMPTFVLLDSIDGVGTLLEAVQKIMKTVGFLATTYFGLMMLWSMFKEK